MKKLLKIFKIVIISTVFCEPLFAQEDYKINQISKIIRVNENTVKSRLARERQKLKQDLEGGLKNE